MNHTESLTLSTHNMQKPLHHAGDLESNDIKRVMPKGLIEIEEISRCLRVYSPANVRGTDTTNLYLNWSRFLFATKGKSVVVALRQQRLK